MNRGAVFLLGCVVAVVGGGAVPGPAGTVLLVLGVLTALAVAASAFFKAADRWSEGAGESRGSRTGSSSYGRLGSSSHRGATTRPSLPGSSRRHGEIPSSRPGKPPVPERKPEPPSRQLPG